MNDKSLSYRLNIIFVLLLLFPCSGFVYFAYKYDLLQVKYFKIFIVIGLVYIFVGVHLLRKTFDSIVKLSLTIKEKVNLGLIPGQVDNNQGELGQIIQSFNLIEQQLRSSSEQLVRRSTEVSILKELSDICYVTLDPWEILYVTLERALLITGADKGSVLILDRSEQKSFIVKACIGLGDNLSIDDRIDFDTSIAKYAVINKSPLVVADIEKDRRFGRSNRFHYGTKSFVIMPIKTIKDVIGVLTISREKEDTVFTEIDVEALAPLISNAAFTYENLRLMATLKLEQQHLALVKKVFKILNSSLRNSELLHAIFNEIAEVVEFEAALIMTRDEEYEDSLQVIDYLSSEGLNVSQGTRISFKGSVLDNVMKQETIMVLDDIETVRETINQAFILNGLPACLIAPLTLRGDVNGVVMFYAGSAGNFHENSALVEGVSHIISFAIEESRLLASVIKRNQELVTIKQIGSALASSTFDINQVLKYTMDMIRTLMNVEAGSLALVKDNKLEFAVGFEVNIDELKKVRLEMGQGISGAVAARGEPAIVNKVSEAAEFYSKLDELTGFETRSVLCVPMISQGKVIGVIEVLNKREGDFSEDDKGILQSIAASVSIALENARLYKETVAMAEQERGIRGMFQKFVPEEIVDKIIHDSATGKTVVDEFKTITLLNIDIRGFSQIAVSIGPQKSVALLNNFFSVMGEIVFKHQGIVDKYLGDGFLALFGAPVSTSMDAENAISAALEMRSALALVNESYAGGILDRPVKIGISLFTGEVVVGNIGFERKMDYTVIGDTVNNVFRLQNFTKPVPNSIVLAESTARAARSALDMKEVEETVAGMKVFELLGRKNNNLGI